MFKNFMLKLKESFMAVFPITLVIFALVLFFVPTEGSEIAKLAISAVLLLLGMALFTMGADSAMEELGKNIGSTLSKSKKLWLMVLCSFVIGFMITFAEPDLMVLAQQVADYSSLSNVWVFISTVSLGVGIFLMFAILKMVFKWKLSVILAICYGIILILSFFVPQQFMPIAFDSGSVTTGPISVPFLISFGLGLSAVRSGNNEDDSFGLIALCSAGPIMAVMILSLFLKPGAGPVVEEVVASQGVFQEIGHALLSYLGDVALILLPIIVLFVLFQIFAFKFPKQKVLKMCMGFIYTFIGITLFLAGVECGYLPMGTAIGLFLGGLDFNWIAIPIGFGLGACAILAEPALQVLKKQVEDITGGVLKQKVIVIVVCIGVACSVAMAVMQSMYNFSLLYIVIPVYVIAIALAFFNTNLFTAVAFDSGGVATGAMAVSFTLPMVIGLSAEGASGFGTIALVAAFPILSMQILGFIYKLVLIKAEKVKVEAKAQRFKIIEFDWDESVSDNQTEKIRPRRRLLAKDKPAKINQPVKKQKVKKEK
ncbi:MAG: DUF1538 domain-containing protein, partial [Clostridia bacterium]|nr:DUF1538 domain-containing protein [Clostridia bacterium]